MRLRAAAVGVLVALAAAGAPTALTASTIRVKGTSASGYKNLQLPTGTVIDASGYRIMTSVRRDPAGLTRTLMIRNNVLWLKPMHSVHTGPKPCNGGLFKWRDSNGYGMRVAMTATPSAST